MKMLTWCSMIAATALSGCATVDLGARGATVAMLSSAPADCAFLGALTGKGGGDFTLGELASDDALLQSAVNDARNKAAKLGASHILLDMPRLVGGDGSSVSGAVVTAMAYSCPPEASAAP